MEMINDIDSRMKHESNDLANKADKLYNFISSNPEYKQLLEKDKQLLKEQLVYMRHYLRVLENRISRRHIANMT